MIIKHEEKAENLRGKSRRVEKEKLAKFYSIHNMKNSTLKAT